MSGECNRERLIMFDRWVEMEGKWRHLTYTIKDGVEKFYVDGREVPIRKPVMTLEELQ
jgi:hypothetical protein